MQVYVGVLGFCTYACIHVNTVGIYVLAFVPVCGGLSLCLHLCVCVHVRVRACLSAGLTRDPDPGLADQVGQEHGGQTRISPAPRACTDFRLLGGA